MAVVETAICLQEVVVVVKTDILDHHIVEAETITDHQIPTVLEVEATEIRTEVVVIE